MRKATASNKRNLPSSSPSLVSELGSISGSGLDLDQGSVTYRHQRKSAKASESLSKSGRHFVADGKQNNKTINARQHVEDQSLPWQQNKIKELAHISGDGQANQSQGVNVEHRKHNHCEIEKRRRDKMNHYIMQLASVIPTFANNQSKFDKLTVLRMAVQHVKSLRSSLCSFSSFHLRPPFLSSGNLLKNLILQMASQEAQDNLFMVVSCDRGKVLFVSQSSKDILNQDQNELVGQCLFDLLHKDDVSKVKEQISYFSLVPKEMLVDSKTLQPIKHNQRQSFSQLQNQSNSTPQPGARRSFFCRMRSGDGNNNNNNQSQKTNMSDVGSNKPDSSKTKTDILSSNNRRMAEMRVDSEAKLSNRDTQLSSSTSQIELSETTSENLSSQVNNINPDLTQLLPSMSLIENLENCSSLDDKNDSTTDDLSDRNLTSKRKTGLVDTLNSNRNKVTRNKSDTKIDSSSSVSSDSSKAESGLEIGESQSVSSSMTGINQTSDRLSSVDSSSSSKSNFKMRSPSANLRMSSSSSRSKKYWRYTVMHCTGYLKSITLNNDEIDDDDYDDFDSENDGSDDEENSTSRTINCLVAVCRRSPINRDLKPDRPLTFTCRYSMEGKFVFVDQRTTLALGYTPQQLLGTSHYAYCHKDSVNTFKECHRQCVLKSESVSSDIYQFKRANGQYLWLQTSLKSFRNPWTKFIDYIVANHTTAEGNDPHYNEGCVPTKFNQDMTGEASQSQSSSPASFSLSLPSMDSKKSSSPSSSSIGSSYSMESYASGASIQALLNQIDRIRSGGIKHASDFTKYRSESSLIRSGVGSARKSNEDSGNYSDPQSCSSLSSMGAVCNEYVNLLGVNNSPENTNNNQVPPQLVNTNNFNLNNAIYFSNNKMNTGDRLSQNSSNSMHYQTPNQQQQQMTNPGIRTHQAPTYEQALNSNQMPGGSIKIISRATDKPTRLSNSSSKQHNRIYNNHYHYKTPSKSCSSTSSDTGNESGIWSNSSGSVYFENIGQQDRQMVEGGQQNQVQSMSKGFNQPIEQQQQPILCDTLHDRSCKVDSHPSYVMQAVDREQMNMAPVQMPMDTQIGPTLVNRVGDNYPTNLMPVAPYLGESVNPRFNETPQQENDVLQQNISMKLEHLATQNIPIMWSQPVAPYQNNANSLHNGGSEQICVTGDVNLMNMAAANSNSQIAVQPAVCGQQSVNHKCCSNQQSTDLNGINLTSLLVDGDLDEDQLLDYLAGYDPETQLYNIQNNAFSNFNI